MKEFTYINLQIMIQIGGIFSPGRLDAEKNNCCCIARCKDTGGTVFL
ncbi:MAG: hypothetical protein J1F64_00715 [Oscillospiraceae bacterium]|nr:hypothetical protein [Oscillospiraceae bacterium]